MDRRIRIETDKAPASTGYRSNAMVAAGFVFTGGHIGAPISTPDNRIPPAETLQEQVDLCLRHMEQLIMAGGGTLKRVVEVSSFLVHSAYRHRHQVSQQVTQFLGFAPPLLHWQEIADVALHAMLELDGVSVVDPQMDLARAADILRPFGCGQGLVHSGPFVMINGLVAPGASLSEQSTNLLARADRLLQEVGSGLDQLVKMTVYLAEFDPYPEFNEATRVAFADFEPPTRSVLVAPAVTGEHLVRVDMIALAGE
ncbi:MAG: RidA family protein [Chloroflexi bacterium]|nr:RidA family protein [Chloroflexota bacterium]